MGGGRASRDTKWIRDAFEKYEGPLLRYALRMTGDLEAARDVVQDTFLRLCGADRKRLEGHLAAWLFTVCRRRVMDVGRRRSRERGWLASEAGETLSDTADPTAVAERREASGQLLRLLERLSHNQQEVVRLRFQNGFSYREISRVSGLSVSNVGYLLHTALRKLRELADAPFVAGLNRE
jgi:RNA polymerase sigma-70 factor (ECF subfamily)